MEPPREVRGGDERATPGSHPARRGPRRWGRDAETSTRAACPAHRVRSTVRRWPRARNVTLRQVRGRAVSNPWSSTAARGWEGRMDGRVSGVVAAALAATLALSGTSVADDAPDEGQILVEEVPNLLRRVALDAMPEDTDAVLESILTFPGMADEILAMHLGRLHRTPEESLPGVAPLVRLLLDRLELLADGRHWEKKLADLVDGEIALVQLPIDAVTAIVPLPTQTVPADPRATPLPERPVDLGDVTYEINGHTRTLDDYLADGQTSAVAFLHDGELVHHDYRNGFSPLTRHQLWSCTKSVTTSLVGIAVEEGLVDSVLDPIERYIPEAAGTVWEGTSVEDLLQMESGIYWVDVPIHQPEMLVLMGIDYHTNGLLGMTRDEYLLQLTRVAEPGVHHRYNSADTQMLAWLLERVYDRDYASILSEKLWQPAGMEQDARIMVDREGHAFASMGLFVTAKDALRFGELFRNGGRAYDGTQVVPEAWVEASTDYSEETGGPRGYQWYPWSDGYSAVGFGHQRIMVGPEHDMVGVRFGNDPVDTIAPAEWEALYLAVAEEVRADAAAQPDTEVEPDTGAGGAQPDDGTTRPDDGGRPVAPEDRGDPPAPNDRRPAGGLDTRGTSTGSPSPAASGVTSDAPATEGSAGQGAPAAGADAPPEIHRVRPAAAPESAPNSRTGPLLLAVLLVAAAVTMLGREHGRRSGPPA
ncbi:serine hydrolase [Nitriliruptoraceae bacterium ZYF776]|nr:serine hydrolase [Profundirhabdus halotolerans]